jgi:hypothetical protein|tara:strand:- start:3059 stop:3262 length:204 start_codon:yes stop_codon:yes gene_type:complete
MDERLIGNIRKVLKNAYMEAQPDKPYTEDIEFATIIGLLVGVRILEELEDLELSERIKRLKREIGIA